MSEGVEQETGHAMGDDRDFFEEDFVNMLPGSWMTLPAGFDVTVSRVSDANAVAIKANDVASSYFGFVPRQHLDSDETKGTIAALHERGIAVSIVDGKTETSIDAVAYEMAVRALDLGAKHPYENPRGAAPPVDWAHAAARGVIRYLDHRFGIIDVLSDADIDDPAVEVTKDLSDIVRAAFIRSAA
ncbi:hypothetical protein HFN53_17100 [Rhizobium leguminosarum]|nr:hypothetical protein [Rhizobium leguminosarum]